MTAAEGLFLLPAAAAYAGLTVPGFRHMSRSGQERETIRVISDEQHLRDLRNFLRMELARLKIEMPRF